MPKGEPSWAVKRATTFGRSVRPFLGLDVVHHSLNVCTAHAADEVAAAEECRLPEALVVRTDRGFTLGRDRNQCRSLMRWSLGGAKAVNRPWNEPRNRL